MAIMATDNERCDFRKIVQRRSTCLLTAYFDRIRFPSVLIIIIIIAFEKRHTVPPPCLRTKVKKGIKPLTTNDRGRVGYDQLVFKWLVCPATQ